MSLRLGLLLLVAVSAVPANAFAQPALTPAAPTATATATPSATASATAAPTATATGTAAPVAAAKPELPQVKAFEDVKKQWTEAREKLFSLQVDYKSAKPEERAAIAEKFTQAHADGAKLQPQVLKAAEAALAADAKYAPAGDFLAAFAQNLYVADRYDECLTLCEALIKANYSNKRVYNIAGKAAFNVENFDLAEKYLKIGQEASALDGRGDRYLVLAPLYKPLWKKEQEIRAAEAKADDLPRVLLKTAKGDITLELFENQAPQAVGNFVSLVDKGFYNGLSFHRVLTEFMAQGGDPNGDGSGGPGYDIYCETDRPDKRLHYRGALSMAHAGKNTGGSQFFITFLPTSNLDGAAVDPKNTGTPHTVFGRVISGLDVLPKLTRREPPGPHSFSKDGAAAPDKILEAKVLRKRSHAYEPTKVAAAPPAAAAPSATPTASPTATSPAPTASATATKPAATATSTATPK